MRKILVILLLFFGNTFEVFSQRSALDSLKREAVKFTKQPAQFAKDTSLAKLLAEIGRIMVDVNADSARKYIDSTERLVKQIKWEKGEAYWLHAKGTLEMEMGAYDEAGDYLFRSLKIFEKYKDQERIAHNLLTAGINFAYAEKYQEGINYHLKSIEVYKKIGSIVGVARNSTNIGNAYLLWKKYNEALVYFLRVKDIYQKNEIPFKKDRMCINAINLSICYYRLGNEKLGEFYENEALKIAKEVEGIYEQYILLEELSSCFFDQKLYQKSIDYANRSFVFANQLMSFEKIATLNGLLYKNYKALGKMDLALNYHEKFKLMEDSLGRTKSREKITELQLKYNSEKQENEINSLKLEKIEQAQNQRAYFTATALIFALIVSLGIFWNNRNLRKNNAKLAKKNKEISEALLKGQTIERKRVAAELHDSLGGNIAALRLQMLGIDKTKFSEVELDTYNEAMAMIQDAYKQVRGLSHNLMPEVLEKEGLVRAIEKLVDKMNNNGLISFELKTNLTEARLEPKVELELYSICLESINNIIKHSGANKAEIELMQSIDNEIVMSISDNGKGLKLNKIEAGMGLKSIENRVNALEGKLKFAENIYGGMKVEINLPNTVK